MSKMEDVHIILGAPKVELIKPLIKTAGIVIGVDRGSIIALEEDITVDVSLGDFDSISTQEKKMIQKDSEELHEYPSVKDDTDLEIALLYVLEHFPKAHVYIYNWHGGRVDHLYSILLLVLQKRFKDLVPYVHLVSSSNVISYYLPGTYTIQKQENMDYLSYILLTEVEQLTLAGVKYTLKEADFDQPISLISNEFLEDEAEFSFKKGIIGVVQSKD